jgi:hypothetical protein
MTAAANKPKRRWWVIPTVILLIVTFFAFLPIISVALTALLANIFHCHVDEGSVHPCPALGMDIGGLLYGMGVMGWFALMTFPAMIAALVGWIVLAAVAVRKALGRKTV